VIAQYHNFFSIVDEDFHHDFPEEHIDQTVNSSHCLCSFVAPTDTTMQLLPVLPIGGSAFASSSLLVHCSTSHSNSNNITNITNITSVEKVGLIGASTTV
jgi:hypothetical protein